MKISKNHYRMFMNVIEKLPKELGILLDQFPTMLQQQGMRFPKKETVQLFVVVPPGIQQQLGLNYTVFGAATSPPHHFHEVGLDEPILELKLSRITGPDSYYTKVWLSMFPSGRLVFEGFGICVDSGGSLSSINVQHFYSHLQEVGLGPLFFGFVLAMLASIEAPDAHTRRIQERARGLFQQCIPPGMYTYA